MNDIPTLKDLEKLKTVSDDTVMTFGKWKGTKLKRVPNSYLYWLFNETQLRKDHPELYDYCEERLEEYDPVMDQFDAGDWCGFCGRPDAACKCGE